MDDGEVELSDHVLIPHSDSSSSIQASLSSDSFLDALLRNTQTCTHTHTCNPPGPDAASHTHTCYHTHTHVIPSTDEKSPVSKPQRPSGNREAVRKYREKKKAHTAYLEEEVKNLRFVNQQLMKKMQRQAVLEAEVSRLRALLFDLKGKIDGELGDFPFQKPCNDNRECGAPPVNDLPGISNTSSGINGCGNGIPVWENNCSVNLSYAENCEKCMGALVTATPRQ